MFHFRLQSLLQYRKQIEDKLVLEFAEIKKRLGQEKEALEKVMRKQASLTTKLENMGKGNLCAANVSVYLSYIRQMKEQQDSRKKIIGKIEKELEAQRQVLLDASQKRKILETINEKKLTEYKLDLIRREQKELDEAGILRAGKGVQIEKTDTYL